MNATPESRLFSRGAFLRGVVLGLPLLGAAALRAEQAVSTSGADAAAPAAGPVPDAGNLRAFVELARSDLRTQKSILIAENIVFTEDEAVEFWPVHREYDLELSRLLDRRLELVTKFVRQHATMTDDEAGRLARASFDLEEKRTALKRVYFKKFSRVVPARKAARFFQIENQIQMALDLQLAAALPLIK